MTKAPTTVFLADYRPYSHLVDAVELTFRLHPTATQVLARLALRPNPDRPGRHPLRLDGEGLKLVSCRLDGRDVTPKTGPAGARIQPECRPVQGGNARFEAALKPQQPAGDALFVFLPEPVREVINGPWRQPHDRGRHQMFGCPDSIQVAGEENDHAWLLLQLQWEDIAGFHWGDAGVLQFWIRPKDLGARRWERAYMTFKGH